MKSKRNCNTSLFICAILQVNICFSKLKVCKYEENTEYSVVIINKLGKEKSVILTKEEMETKLFEINKEVSLKEDGSLEPVVHKVED